MIDAANRTYGHESLRPEGIIGTMASNIAVSCFPVSLEDVTCLVVINNYLIMWKAISRTNLFRC